VGTTYKGLPGDVKPGDTLLIDDGKLQNALAGFLQGGIEHLCHFRGQPPRRHDRRS
jgi:hypothetical protein